MHMKPITLILWMLMLVGCGTPVGTEVPDTTTTTSTTTSSGSLEDRLALDTARSAWASVDRPWYRYTYTASCECPAEFGGPNEVTIQAEAVTNVTYRGPSDIEQPFAVEGVGWTAEELFDLIEASIARGVDNQVTYFDSGLPRIVFLDLEAMAVDGGFAIEIDASDDPVEELASLEAARSRWEASGITDYSFHFFSGTMALSDYTAIVNGTEVFVDGDYVWGPTDMGLVFKFIEEAILGAPHTFSAEYDPTTGVPSGYDVDPIEFAIDDEASPRITEFTVIDVG